MGTGSRAEYGLLFWLMKNIEECEEFSLQIIATGMHLSPEFGMTYKEIENDGFVINKKVRARGTPGKYRLKRMRKTTKNPNRIDINEHLTNPKRRSAVIIVLSVANAKLG